MIKFSILVVELTTKAPRHTFGAAGGVACSQRDVIHPAQHPTLGWRGKKKTSRQSLERFGDGRFSTGKAERRAIHHGEVRSGCGLWCVREAYCHHGPSSRLSIVLVHRAMASGDPDRRRHPALRNPHLFPSTLNPPSVHALC